MGILRAFSMIRGTPTCISICAPHVSYTRSQARAYHGTSYVRCTAARLSDTIPSLLSGNDPLAMITGTRRALTLSVVFPRHRLARSVKGPRAKTCLACLSQKSCAVIIPYVYVRIYSGWGENTFQFVCLPHDRRAWFSRRGQWRGVGLLLLLCIITLYFYGVGYVKYVKPKTEALVAVRL